MARAQAGGPTPQNPALSAPGVSLSHPESEFLALVSDPACSPFGSEAAAKAAGLTVNQAAFIKTWVEEQDGRVSTVAREAGLTPRQANNCLINPKVRRILQAAAEAGICKPLIPDAEEILGDWGQIARDPFEPPTRRDESRKEIARLRGYYADGKGSSGGNAVQIIINDPYKEVVVNGN